MSRDINLDLIDRDPGQPRRYFDPEKLAELAQSMQEKGLIQAILVRPTGNRYTIIHGERRYRAAQALGWATIAADVRAVDEDEAHWLALIENVQRADLTPIEEAEAYQERLDGGLTQAELGRRIGKSQSYIAQKLRLLTLPEPLELFLARGALTEGHARQLLRLRAFYRDTPARFDWQGTRFGELAPEAWAPLGFALLRDIRPEDNPPVWIDPRTAKAGPLLTEACGAFYSYVMGAGGTVPRWAVTAFWWASAAVYLGLSVADLSKGLDNWQDLILAAVAWLLLHEDGAEPRSVLDKMHHFGHLSDLRHAGLSSWATEPPGPIAEKALEQLGEEGAWLSPSSCQAWGFSYGAYTAALQAEREAQRL